MAHISNKARQISSFKHIQKSAQTGASGEQRFYDSCKAAGKNIKKSSANHDIYKHIDFLVDEVSFDVKGLKQSQKEGKILLELLNVKGQMGWCNNKETPQYIAFDFGGFFLCVCNKDLYKFVKSKCDLNYFVDKIEDSIYKAYRRKDRMDLITLIKLEDALRTCDHWFLPYQEYKTPMELL